jgi:hypothetical protein
MAAILNCIETSLISSDICWKFSLYYRGKYLLENFLRSFKILGTIPLRHLQMKKKIERLQKTKLANWRYVN